MTNCKVNFLYGSVSVGNEIEQYCTQHQNPCSLELNGTDVAIIRYEVNIELASAGVVWGCIY
jgi:acyl-CoA reductase-like NAD-dependent aldehyde dehydrogenase